MASEVSRPLKHSLHDHRRLDTISRTSAGPRFPIQVPQGFLTTQESAGTGATESPGAGPSTSSQTSQQNALQMLMAKRVAATNPVQQEPPKKKRKPRTCQKCGDDKQCKGRGDRSLCLGVCRDCKRSDCKGRETDELNLPCKTMLPR